MTKQQESMFQTLLRTLEKESNETKAMFFAEPESDLIKAYQEGKEARLNKLRPDQNPYPKPSDHELERYSKFVCWSEGFVAGFFSEL